MHEAERHRIIMASVESRPVVTIADLVEITGASEATVRRDIAALHEHGRVRRVRGGAEALVPPGSNTLAGRPYRINENINSAQKRSIARAAVEMCQDGELVMINGGTTTFQMVHYLVNRRLEVFTNSFTIAEYLVNHSANTVVLPGGAIYRDQNIILSPFEHDNATHLSARKLFLGCQGIGPQGLMEGDPLLVQAELKFMNQADEVIVLADSSKFSSRSGLVLCGLGSISTVITDSGIRDDQRRMLQSAGVGLIVVETAPQEQSSSVA